MFGDEDHPQYKAPKALRRLQKQFTEEKRLAVFQKQFGRPPQSDAELAVFCEVYLLEHYNNGHDDL